jgi:hypothetical protein
MRERKPQSRASAGQQEEDGAGGLTLTTFHLARFLRSFRGRGPHRTVCKGALVEGRPCL